MRRCPPFADARLRLLHWQRAVQLRRRRARSRQPVPLADQWGAAGPPGRLSEDLLLHLDGSARPGPAGEPAASAQNARLRSPANGVRAWPSRTAGRLQLGRTGYNLRPGPGNSIELWVALRADGTNSGLRGTRDHVVVPVSGRRTATTRRISSESAAAGFIYAGGTVSGQWESAYGNSGQPWRAGRAGEWHHLAFHLFRLGRISCGSTWTGC